MKKKIITVFLVSLITFCGCSGKIDKNNNSDNANAQGNTYKITDLGICSDENISLPVNARVPWDLVVVDGTIYVGTGDFDSNTGPTSIWSYDNVTKKWTASTTVDQEAIARFVDLEGQIVALGTDPVGDPEYACCYALENSAWQTFSNINGALHIFDAESYSDLIYYGVGSEKNKPVIVKQNLTTGEYEKVSLYKKGIDIIASLKESTDIRYMRVYDLFSANGKLFCAFSCSYTTGKTTLEFFELNGDRFEFCQSFINSNLRMNKAVKNQLIFNCDAVYENSCFLSLGDLYKTDDFNKFDKIDVPNNACVTDMLVEKNNGQEFLYVLATIQDGEEYKNFVYTMDDNKLTEVFSFNTSVSAMSFAKYDNIFYVGVGNLESKNANNGRILKIEFGVK